MECSIADAALENAMRSGVISIIVALLNGCELLAG